MSMSMFSARSWRPTLLLLALTAAPMAQAESPVPVATVLHVDLARYMGTWYEIAHFPIFFQRKCVGDTTAQYTNDTDGTITVTNRCRNAAGGMEQAKGTAQAVPNSGNAKLDVIFFWPFKGDYWVIGLDPHYRWAVIGGRNRNTLWVLARTPTLAPADLDSALTTAKAQGYALNKLTFTVQNGKTSAPHQNGS